MPRYILPNGKAIYSDKDIPDDQVDDFISSMVDDGHIDHPAPSMSAASDTTSVDTGAPIIDIPDKPNPIRKVASAVKDIATTPLTTRPSIEGNRIANWIDPKDSSSSNVPLAMLRGFHAGTIQGLGDLTTSMTNPLDLATMIGTEGAGWAAKRGFGTLAKIAHGVARGGGAAAAIRGASKVLSPSSTIMERGSGVLETLMGITGYKSKLPEISTKVATGKGPIKSTELPMEVPIPEAVAKANATAKTKATRVATNRASEAGLPEINLDKVVTNASGNLVNTSSPKMRVGYQNGKWINKDTGEILNPKTGRPTGEKVAPPPINDTGTEPIRPFRPGGSAYDDALANQLKEEIRKTKTLELDDTGEGANEMLTRWVKEAATAKGGPISPTNTPELMDLESARQKLAPDTETAPKIEPRVYKSVGPDLTPETNIDHASQLDAQDWIPEEGPPGLRPADVAKFVRTATGKDVGVQGWGGTLTDDLPIEATAIRPELMPPEQAARNLIPEPSNITLNKQGDVLARQKDGTILNKTTGEVLDSTGKPITGRTSGTNVKSIAQIQREQKVTWGEAKRIYEDTIANNPETLVNNGETMGTTIPEENVVANETSTGKRDYKIKRGPDFQSDGVYHITFDDGRTYPIYKNTSGMGWEVDGLDDASQTMGAFTKNELVDRLRNLNEDTPVTSRYNSRSSGKTIKETLSDFRSRLASERGSVSIIPERSSANESPGKIKARLQKEGKKDLPILEEEIPTKPAKPGIGEKDPGLLRKAIDTTRGLMSVDLPFTTSAAFRQAMPWVGTKNWFKAWATAAKSYGSQVAHDAFMANIKESPLFRDRVIKFKDGNSKTFPSFADEIGVRMTDIKTARNARLEGIRSQLAEKIPLYGAHVKASNRAFAAFLNDLKANQLTQFVKDGQAMAAASKDPSLDLTKNIPLAKEFAEFLNDSTGSGSLKFGVKGTAHQYSLEQHAQKLADAFFSPRLTASRINMLNPTSYVMGNPAVRKQYMLAMLRTVGAWWGFANMAQMAGGKVVSDPNNSDFGKIKIGNTRFDPGAGFQQFLVLGHRVMPKNIPGTNRPLALPTKQFKTGNALTDLPLDYLGTPGGQYASSISGTSRDYGVGFNAPTRADAVVDFAASKGAPIPKLIWDIFDANERRPVFLGDRLAQLFLPMATSDINELLRENPELLMMGILSSGVGFGGQTYTGAPDKPKITPMLGMIPGLEGIDKMDYKIGGR